MRLTRKLFDVVKSGGHVLVANFVPDILDVGFMESYMGWKLIYRDRKDLLGVAGEIDLNEVDDFRLYTEATGSILFLEIVKR